VYRDSDEVTDDVDLEEFKDEIEPWIIEALKNIGCDTARSVVEIAPDELAKRTDLEEETVTEVLRVLKSELAK
jgi:N utilization substance protein A